VNLLQNDNFLIDSWVVDKTMLVGMGYLLLAQGDIDSVSVLQAGFLLARYGFYWWISYRM
jgi:hypothetical protein